MQDLPIEMNAGIPHGEGLPLVDPHVSGFDHGLVDSGRHPDRQLVVPVQIHVAGRERVSECFTDYLRLVMRKRLELVLTYER